MLWRILSNDIAEEASKIILCDAKYSLSIKSDHPLYEEASSLAKSQDLQKGQSITTPAFSLVCLEWSANNTGWRDIGGKLYTLFQHKAKVCFLLTILPKRDVQNLVYGFLLRNWRFDKYHTKKRPLPKIKYEEVYFAHPEEAELQSLLEQDQHLIGSVHWGRNIANEPGNVIYPETFVREIEEFKKLGIKIEILDKDTLKQRRCGALLGVAQGSVCDPYVVLLYWEGGNKGEAPLALVGKGVTFDSGGLSLKPSSGMEDMKMDKTGAVVVSSTIRALALQKAPINVVAVLALVENMPSGSAQRPGDIVTTMSGQTVEVLNTDAEGRLILADALWLVQEDCKPHTIIDVATLTGAIRVALGTVYAGLFANDDTLAHQLIEAGKDVGENLWRLPLNDAYNEALNSNVADMQNITNGQIGGGSCTAAEFLHRFIQKEVRWAHLDIASVDHAVQDKPTCPKGATAFGIQLLVRYCTQSFKMMRAKL